MTLSSASSLVHFDMPYTSHRCESASTKPYPLHRASTTTSFTSTSVHFDTPYFASTQGRINQALSLASCINHTLSHIDDRSFRHAVYFTSIRGRINHALPQIDARAIERRPPSHRRVDTATTPSSALMLIRFDRR
jgi:hypothetical protein